MVDINRSDVVSKDSVIQSLQDDNLALRSELEEKEEVINELLTTLNNVTYHPPSNTGKSIDEVGERQRRRKLMTLREASKKALWFLDSFNIDVQSIIVKTRNNEFYHELSMLHPSLPRLCAVKARRSNISSNVPILRLPKPHSGCYRSLKEYLAEILMKKKSYLCHVVRQRSYKTLKEGFAPVIDDINDLIEKSVIEVNGIDVTLDVIFGGDYKTIRCSESNGIATFI
uniref:Uncharacterized protein n=1 Tax=Amphimedon queenslandica TaxID=400682 RepID=A0A1X7T1F4_AMPQE